MYTTVLADQQKLTFISSLHTLDAIKRTCQEWWPIRTDGKKDSRESVPSDCFDDDDDDDIHKIYNI